MGVPIEVSSYLLADNMTVLYYKFSKLDIEEKVKLNCLSFCLRSSCYGWIDNRLCSINQKYSRFIDEGSAICITSSRDYKIIAMGYLLRAWRRKKQWKWLSQVAGWDSSRRFARFQLMVKFPPDITWKRIFHSLVIEILSVLQWERD